MIKKLFFLTAILFGLLLTYQSQKTKLADAHICSGCYLSRGIQCGTQCCNCGGVGDDICCSCGCKPSSNSCSYWCCSPVNGTWGTCSSTTLLSLCGTANSCGTQSCTPAGGYKTCCSAGATVTFSANYPGSAAVVSPFGPANGTLNITGGTTTVTGATLDFNVLNVSTGYISVTATGIAKTSATCVN